MDKQTFRLLQILTCLLAIQTCYAYEFYQRRIPNGERVPHPCKANNLWKGVGHKNVRGGGERNQFGVDFAANGAVWDSVICNMDSDGDGMTNGEELGDPNCQWKPTQTPTRTLGLSHPGIYDPFSNATAPEWVSCEKEQFKCDVLDEPETFNFTVRIPETDVPAKETTYKCMFFEFPSDQEYHMVANVPYIDNEAVMHHILVFGCTENITKDVALNEARDCGMGSGHQSCTEIIATWTVGLVGSCEHPHTGFLIGGTRGYQFGSFQFHWNNPEERSGYTDSSGVSFFLTPKLRMYNAGVLMIGQRYLEIPPGELSVVSEGGCSSKCTQEYMGEPVNITSVFNHMHYLGKSQFTQIRRNGIKVDTLADDEKYNYDSPVVRVYADPVVARPGDELRTTCVFQSTSTDKTTYFGDETADEMCLAFLTYYPKEKIRSSECLRFASLDSCELFTGVVSGCNLTRLSDFSDRAIMSVYESIAEKCHETSCRKECKEYIKVLKNTDPCYQGDVYKMRKNNFFGVQDYSYEVLQFYSRTDSCDTEIAVEKLLEGTGPGGETGAASYLNVPAISCFLGILSTLYMLDI